MASKFEFRRFRGVFPAPRRSISSSAYGVIGSERVEIGRGQALSTRAAEKLGKLGEPGFPTTLSRSQLLRFLLVADPPEGRQEVREGGFPLAPIPGTVRETHEAVADVLEPHDDEAVQHQGHRSR